ncbi:MAG: hypothetical protein QW434_00010 [Pyrobaculum sp.]
MYSRAAISVFVLDVSAVLLAVSGFLSAVSGLCLVKPELVERATLGLFGEYAVCSKLHLEWPMLAAILTAVIHGAAGLDVWLMRLGRDAWWVWAAALAMALWFIYLYFN